MDCGATIVLQEGFDVDDYLDNFGRYGCTVMGAVTPVFQLMGPLIPLIENIVRQSGESKKLSGLVKIAQISYKDMSAAVKEGRLPKSK